MDTSLFVKMTGALLEVIAMVSWFYRRYRITPYTCSGIWTKNTIWMRLSLYIRISEHSYYSHNGRSQSLGRPASS